LKECDFTISGALNESAPARVSHYVKSSNVI